MFLLTVVKASSAKSALQQRQLSPRRVHHRSLGVLAILPSRVRARCGSWLKPWCTNLCAHRFQLAKLVWPPLVLGDSHRLMAEAEQVVYRKFNALLWLEQTFDRILLAAECVGPLVVNSREVVDFELDTGNFGPSCGELHGESLHDGSACGDVRALPQRDEARGRQWRAQAADK